MEHSFLPSFIFINKPLGMTSYDIATQISKLIESNEVQPIGILDRHTSGIVPISLGATEVFPECFSTQKFDGILHTSSVLTKGNIEGLLEKGKILSEQENGIQDVVFLEHEPEEQELYFSIQADTSADARSFITLLRNETTDKIQLKNLHRTSIGDFSVDLPYCVPPEVFVYVWDKHTGQGIPSLWYRHRLNDLCRAPKQILQTLPSITVGNERMHKTLKGESIQKHALENEDIKIPDLDQGDTIIIKDPGGLIGAIGIIKICPKGVCSKEDTVVDLKKVFPSLL